MGVELLLEMAVSAHPDRVAVRDGRRELTYDELRRAAGDLAARLHAQGARSLAFVGVNSAVVPIALFGAALAGVPFTPLNYRLSADALDVLVGRLDAPLVLGDSDKLTALSLSDSVVEVVDTDTIGGPSAGSNWSPPETDDGAPVVMLFTSGTTAAPKGVLLRHHQLMAYILQTVEFDAGAGETSLVSLPPYHVAGVGAVLSNIYSGRCLSYLADFSAQVWLDRVRSERVTSAMVVPTMLARVVDSLDGEPADVPSLRFLAYGGARMPLPVLEAAVAAFPDTGFTNAYGLTETSSTIAVLSPDDHRDAMSSDDPLVRQRLGSAGRFVPGVEGQIRGPDRSLLGPGEIGALWVRGPQVSGDYAETGSVLDEDGWFATRDDAWLDAGGYLFIAGRTDDTIIRGGENIAPDEVEQTVITHPDVADVAVFGTPDTQWGERTVACIVLRSDAVCTEADIREWARTRARSSRTPDVVRFVDNLPYSPTGKLLRRELKGTIGGAEDRTAAS
ncbi:class I adenylate-forming enzyme family protein [Pseudonocardia ailaonensis]